MKVATKGIIVILVLIVGLAVFDKFNYQKRLNNISSETISSIQLEHYNETITIESTNPNYDEIINLMKTIKVRHRYIGLPLYGMPITTSFYSGEELIISVASGYKYTDIDNKRFYTSSKSREAAKRLDTILGKYYGYSQ